HGGPGHAVADAAEEDRVGVERRMHGQVERGRVEFGGQRAVALRARPVALGAVGDVDRPAPLDRFGGGREGIPRAAGRGHPAPALDDAAEEHASATDQEDETPDREVGWGGTDDPARAEAPPEGGYEDGQDGQPGEAPGA